MTIEHRASRLIDQRPDVVHARLLELAERLRRELPPIEPGTQAATALGMSGRVDVEIVDRSPSRIELRTTQGRIRGEGAADLVPTPDGKTNLTLAMAIRPKGFAANMMLGVALKTMPGIEQRVVDGLERGLDDLVVELAKPDDEWDAASWQPKGLPARP
ncbi:MAG TPA: hypothetical protein VFY18_09640 [Candidatus Limnocylindrales bacterium]|nr:hypothetical protein [Candidatus Limnocylindrales bacterium]